MLYVYNEKVGVSLLFHCLLRQSDHHQSMEHENFVVFSKRLYQFAVVNKYNQWNHRRRPVTKLSLIVNQHCENQRPYWMESVSTLCENFMEGRMKIDAAWTVTRVGKRLWGHSETRRERANRRILLCCLRHTTCVGAATAHDADHKMAATRYCKEIRNNVGGCRAWDQTFDPPYVEGTDTSLARAVSGRQASDRIRAFPSYGWFYS